MSVIFLSNRIIPHFYFKPMNIYFTTLQQFLKQGVLHLFKNSHTALTCVLQC